MFRSHWVAFYQRFNIIDNAIDIIVVVVVVAVVGCICGCESVAKTRVSVKPPCSGWARNEINWIRCFKFLCRVSRWDCAKRGICQEHRAVSRESKHEIEAGKARDCEIYNAKAHEKQREKKTPTYRPPNELRKICKRARANNKHIIMK